MRKGTSTRNIQGLNKVYAEKKVSKAGGNI